MTDSKISRIDDLNWGRLNLISAQDSIADQHHWQVDLSQGNRLVKITCRALPEYGIPHGLDNDVSSALIDFYQSCELPEDGKIGISMTDLLMLAGFPRNGKYWALLKTSLERLHTTSYSISGGWRDHPNRRWTTAKFHFIEGIEYTHEGEAGKFDSRTVLQIKLADPLVTSLRSGYTKPLNIEFMHSLSRPRTRILFRLLDAMRYNPEQIDETVDAFSVRLVEWADQCKLPNTRPDLIRRALAAPHEELIKRGYLQSVTYEGRGRAQSIFYTFSPDFTPVSPALLNRFRKHGVADGVTRQLVRTYTTSVLHSRIELFEQLVKSGQLVVKKTAAAALVHLIKHADQYGNASPVRDPAPMVARASVVKAASQDAPPPDVAAELAALTPEGRATYVLQRLNLLYKKYLRPLDFDLLRDAVMHGRVDAAAIVTLAIHSRASGSEEAFVAALRRELFKE